MSEQYPGFSDTAQQDINAEVFRYSLELASNPAELRSSFQDNGKELWHTSKQSFEALAETMTEKLWTLGLDLNDISDTRIEGFHKGVAALKAGPDEAFGPKRQAHDTNHPEVVLMKSYGRILSGLDMRSPDRIQLLPLVPFQNKELLSEIARSALLFTSGDEYTHRGVSYPRKAGRMITDVSSPFWNCGIGTDDYPGTEFGIDGRGPNVSVWVPTGTMTDASVLALHQNKHLQNSTWESTTAAGYVPDRIVAQRIRMGVPTDHSDQVDTSAGYVASFLRAAETL